MAKFFLKYWDYYALLGTSPAYDGEENTKISLMNYGYLFCAFGCLVSAVLRIFYEYDFLMILRPLTLSLLFCFLPLFSYFKKHRIGWHLAGICLLLGITLASLQQPILHVNYLIYGSITFLVIYLHNDNKKIQYFYLVFIALNIVAFTYFSSINAPEGAVFPLTISLIIIAIALLSQFWLISISFEYRLNKERQLAYAISLKNAALDANKDATIIVDSKGKITDFNKQYMEIWGISEAELKGGDKTLVVTKCLPKIANRNDIIATLNTITNNPSISTFDVIYLTDGRIIESHTQPQKIDNQVVGRVLNYRDVTEKYQSAKQLKESENRFRRFFEHSPFGVILLDDEQRPLANVNQELCEIFGYTAAEMAELKLDDICDPSYEEQHTLDLKAQMRLGKNNFNLLNKYVRKSGESFWGNLNMSFNRDENGRILSTIGMIQDINDKKLQEEKIKDLIVELKLLNEELEQKVKTRTVDLRQSNAELRRSNQDLEQFAYIASHDLQEPLRMVGNFVQLLERQYKDQIDDEGKEFIGYIVDGVNRMSKLIHNLLKYSRVGRKESELRSVKLDRIVEAKLFGLTQKIEDTNAKVIVHPMPKETYCEPDQLGMVFYNLITNGLKFNKSNPQIEIGCLEKEEDYQFFVKDNGIGIDNRYEAKIFEIFKRLHRREEYEGTGIGLALCKKIIARHKGNIWFDSEPNKGTTFYFTISKSLKNEKYVPLDTNLVG